MWQLKLLKKTKSIKAGNLNSHHSYLITTVFVWVKIDQRTQNSFCVPGHKHIFIVLEIYNIAFALSISKISKMDREIWSVFFYFLFDKIWRVLTRFLNFLIAKGNKTNVFWIIWCRFEIENLWPSMFIISYLKLVKE